MSEQQPPRRGNIPLIVAAAVVTVVVVAAVLMFGIARPPAVDPLTADPDPAPPASLTWTDLDGDEPCLVTVTPDTTVTRLRCGHDLGSPIAWDAEGIYVLGGDRWNELRVYDPRTGEQRHRLVAPDQTPIHRVEPEHRVERAGSFRVILDGADQPVWETTAHEHYHIRTSSRSPDGQWVVLHDSADRILVVPADGHLPPRVWVEGVTGGGSIVWEGATLEDDGLAAGGN